MPVRTTHLQSWSCMLDVWRSAWLHHPRHDLPACCQAQRCSRCRCTASLAALHHGCGGRQGDACSWRAGGDELRAWPGRSRIQLAAREYKPRGAEYSFGTLLRASRFKFAARAARSWKLWPRCRLEGTTCFCSTPSPRRAPQLAAQRQHHVALLLYAALRLHCAAASAKRQHRPRLLAPAPPAQHASAPPLRLHLVHCCSPSRHAGQDASLLFSPASARRAVLCASRRPGCIASTAGKDDALRRPAGGARLLPRLARRAVSRCGARRGASQCGRGRHLEDGRWEHGGAQQGRGRHGRAASRGSDYGE